MTTFCLAPAPLRQVRLVQRSQARALGAGGPAAAILQLQRSAGNRAVTGLLANDGQRALVTEFDGVAKDVAASGAYAIGQVRTGRVTRLAEFGAFVELEPGVEGLAHASTFAPTGRSEGWSALVASEMTGAFEILSIDLEKRRIGVALVPEGSARAAGTALSQLEIVPGARLTGKVERHEKFGVFVFLAPGRTGLIPLSETGVAKEADISRAFPVGADVEVIVLEVDPLGRRIRLSAKAVLDAHEVEEVREYTEREDVAPAEGFGSLADKLRGALKPREK